MTDDKATDVKLDLILSKIEGIENCLYGQGGREGIRIDVDRLKQSNLTHSRVLWAIFTGLVGLSATYLSSFFH